MMRTFLLKWLTAVFAVMLVSSLVSMMAVFVGSEGEDLRDLMVLQAILIPLAAAAGVWCLGSLVLQYGCRNALRKFWDCLPGWLVFAVFAANSPVLIAELSFALLQHHTLEPTPWQERVPAATALSSSLALVSCYVRFRLSG